MCGRFITASSAEKIAATFAVPNLAAFEANDDIRPSTLIAVIALKQDGLTRGLARLRWGLVPHWSQTDKPKHVPINIRSESALDKFGHQVRHNRCLIPADGFFEWSGEKKKKRKYLISMRDGSPFAFAGVWDVWQGDKQKLVTCAFLTTGPNDLIRSYHDRMPVIVPPTSYGEWLDHGTPIARIETLFEPDPAELMRVVDVTTDGPGREDQPSLFAA